MTWEAIGDIVQKRLSTKVGRESLSDRHVEFIQMQLVKEMETAVNRAIFLNAMFGQG